jgi:hypothetical protein
MNTLWPAWIRHRISHRAAAPRAIARTGLLAIIGALLLGAGIPASVMAQDGEYILQCSCPIAWEEPWEGAAGFEDDASLDTVALANDGAVLLVHEIPLEEGSIDGMIEDRTDTLDRSRAISDLDEAFADDSREDATAGRVWVNEDGDTMYGFQFVQVWETNYLLSIELIANEDDFAAAWESTNLVTLVGQPILADLDGEDIVEAFEDGDLPRN